jgi:hypothetical protein
MSVPYAVDFVGSISGTTLTVESITTGTIVAQQIVFSSDPAVVVEPNTRITGGSGLSWTVSPSQTVGSNQLFTVYDPTIVVSGSVESEYTIATPIPTVTFTSSGAYTPNAVVTPPTYTFRTGFGTLTGNDVTLTVSSNATFPGSVDINNTLLYNNVYNGPDTLNTFTPGEVFEFTIPSVNSASIQFSDQQSLAGNVGSNPYWQIDGFQFVPLYAQDSIRYTTLTSNTQSLEFVTARVSSAVGDGGSILYTLDSPVDTQYFGLTITTTGFTTFSAANVSNAVPTFVDYNQFSVASSTVGSQSFTQPARATAKFKILEQAITTMQLSGSFSWDARLATDVTFRVIAPDRRLPLLSSTPVFAIGPDTSSQIIPFISGAGSTQLTFGSPTGFQAAPFTGLNFTVFQQLFDGTILNRIEYSNINVNPITITSVPAIPGTLSINQYVPFSYLFSIPDTLVNVILQSTTTANLTPYLASDLSEFSSDVGFTSALTGSLRIDALLNGITSIANVSSTVTAPALVITVTPPISTGTLNLYKYEAFGPYTFTIPSGTTGLTLQFTRSSSELRAFLSLVDQTATFAGTFNISYSAPLSLVVDVLFGTTIVSTQTISVTVAPGRFFPPTANQNFQLFQYENVSNTFGSNPAFLTALAINTIVSSPALPTGLSFGGSGNVFFLQGVPALQTAQSNYQVIGSNSTNGKIVTVTVSLIVNPQTVRITPSFTTLSGLTVDTPITPITFTALIPQTIYAFEFRYAWTGLPDGFSFQDGDGNTVVNNAVRSNPGQTPILVLVGTPTLEFATLMSTAENLYQTRLTASILDQTGRQTTGSALINFSFAETVLISVAANEVLYQSKLLGPTDFVITVGSFFPSTTIGSLTVDELPPGLSLVEVTATTYRLSGTPTVVDLNRSYTFTATNTNGLTRSITQPIAINPDVVTFGGTTPANGSAINYIVSRSSESPIRFTATSVVGAAALPIVYSASIDFVAYGLALNASTGSLTGLPTVALSQTTVTISATDALGTIGTTTILLTIAPDIFVFPTYAPTYFQNRPITSFQFVMVSTASGRPIQSYLSTDLPAGLVLNPSGLLSGTPTVGTSGNFTVTATTGYSSYSQLYSFTIIPDNLLILQVNGSDSISRVFSGIVYQVDQYSTDTIVPAVFSIGTLSPASASTIAVTSAGVLSGDFTDATSGVTYQAILTATYRTLTATAPVNILFSGSTGTISIPTELSELTFVEPTQSSFLFFQYVPYTIPLRATGSGSFIYYYTSRLPLGFQVIPDSLGVAATLTGNSTTLTAQGLIVYAKTAAGYATSRSITLTTVIPYFVNPQLGASAYTAQLRNSVEANAAQNARDNTVFPEVNPLPGPFMGPRAPDVVTELNCLQKLCKKPCPNCHTMM